MIIHVIRNSSTFNMTYVLHLSIKKTQIRLSGSHLPKTWTIMLNPPSKTMSTVLNTIMRVTFCSSIFSEGRCLIPHRNWMYSYYFCLSSLRFMLTSLISLRFSLILADFSLSFYLITYCWDIRWNNTWVYKETRTRHLPTTRVFFLTSRLSYCSLRILSLFKLIDMDAFPYTRVWSLVLVKV